MNSQQEKEKPPPQLCMPFVDDLEYGFDECSQTQEKGVLDSGLDIFLSNYEDKGVIGQGNNGRVHLFQSKKKPNTKYAVKIMRMTSPQTISNLQKNFDQVGLLKAAPHIIRYYAIYFDKVQLLCYLVMEYHNSPSLVVKRPYMGDSSHSEYTQNELRNIVYQVLKGLSALHKRDFIHRDIKPDNILYDKKTMKAVIVDLGVSRWFNSKQNKGPVSIAGTLDYRAPEMSVAQYDSKVDIWSLGITIYELITGVNPFGHLKNMKVEDVVETIKERSRKLKFEEPQWEQYRGSKYLMQLLENMLKFHPKDRWSADKCLQLPWFVETNSPNLNLKVNEGVDRNGIKSEGHYKSSIHGIERKSIPPTKNFSKKQPGSYSRILVAQNFCDTDQEFDDEDDPPNTC